MSYSWLHSSQGLFWSSQQIQNVLLINISIKSNVSELFVRVRLCKSSTWKILVSLGTKVALIGMLELLVWTVTSMGPESLGTDSWSKVLLWLIVKSSNTVLEVLGGTIISRGTFPAKVVPEPAIVWVSTKQLLSSLIEYECSL